jgi:hypothetical protein
MTAAGAAVAYEPSTPPNGTYKPAAAPAARRAFFGELHLHTTMSFDAWTFGTKVTPDQAYKFGRGEAVRAPAYQLAREQGFSGDQDVMAQRAWPLDFMAVTDHSEQMGVLAQLDDPNTAAAKSPMGQAIQKGIGDALARFSRGRRSGEQFPELHQGEAIQSAWAAQVKASNDNYRPGKFTTFIAYEWTATAPDREHPGAGPIGTIHRNVIFNSDHAPSPFTSADSPKPEDLWTYLEKVRAGGIDAIDIPHNGNLSGGMAYDWNQSDGRPIDEVYAQRRALNEPLTEIAQTKGQSETVPELSPNDEFSNFEIYDHLLVQPNFKPRPNGSYIRQALGRGLVIQSKVNTNPFKYGFVGGSDIHNGLSVSDESGAAGEASGLDPRTMLPRGDDAKRILGIIKQPRPANPAFPTANTSTNIVLKASSGGLTGVWAEENTRNSIFAALKRKETFATTGTRIRVRMFGGWNFVPGLVAKADWVKTAYGQGVPMGSDLPVRPAAARAPTFILQATKDPDGANLDRLQMIKVWLDGGEYKEKVFEVTLSGGRKVDPRTGKAPPVRNTVDLATGAFKNTVGAPAFSTVWRDPDFDPKKPAVYYARVLEIPTPRWTTLLAIKNHLPISNEVPATIQERAWSSPIWFTPPKA